MSKIKMKLRRTLSLFLAVVLACTTMAIGTTAFAQTGYNEQLMAALEGMCGSTEEAQHYYDMLEEYGFLDENGNAAESWSITMDGKAVSLEEIRDLLGDDTCDKSQFVVVDGTPVTLENLETMIAIEDYITYLEETYYSPQVWSEEQLANLDDLVAQINAYGIELLADEEESWIGSVNHGVRLSAEILKNGTNVTSETKVSAGDELTLKVTPNAAQIEDITFSVRTLNGSATAQIDDEDLLKNGVTIAAGSTDAVEIPIKVGSVNGRVNGTATFLVQIYNITNALIYTVDKGNNTVSSTRWEQEITVTNEEEFRYRVETSGKTEAIEDDFAFVEHEQYMKGDGWACEMMASWGNWNLFDTCFPEGYTHKSSSDMIFNYIYDLPFETLQTTDTVLEFDLSTLKAEGEEITGTVTAGSVTIARPDLYGDSRYESTTDGVVTTNELFFDGPFYNVGSFEQTVSTLNYLKNVDTGTDAYAYSKILDKSLGQFGTAFDENIPFKGYETMGWSTCSSPNLGELDMKDTIQIKVTNTCDTRQTHGSYHTNGKRSLIDNYFAFFFPSVSSFDVTLTVWDTTQAATATLSVPEGTYYAGQTIPITATFDYPMNITKDMFITVNEQELKPVETGSLSTTCTFLYEVQDADMTSLYFTGDEEGYGLDGLGANELDVDVKLDTSSYVDGQISDDVLIDTPDKEAAFLGLEATLENPTTNPVLNVTLGITGDENLTAWLLDDLPLDEGTGISTSKSLTILYNGVEYPLSTDAEFITGGTLTAEIPIDLNTGEDEITVGVELLIDGNVSMRLYATVTQEPAVFITEDDIDAKITVLQTSGSPYVYADDTYTVWLQDQAGISVALELPAGKTFSFGDTSLATVLTKDDDENWVPADDTADFIWWVGDEDGNPDTTVANIDKNGNITAVGTSGTAYIYITALNGDNKVSDEGGRAVTVLAYQMAVLEEDGDPEKVDFINFDMGLTPFLYIPYNDVTSVAGQDVTIYWTSNLCDKNGDEPTEFSVTLTCDGKEVYSTVVTGTADDPASGITIPGDVLNYTYGDDSKNVYTLTVSTDFEEVEYADTATITLQPNPATVTLNQLETYYIPDDPQSVDITWDIDSFNYFEEESEEQFEFLITSGDGDVVYRTNVPGASLGDGKYEGSYSLEITDVKSKKSDVTSYREIYTVTIAAKNGGDSTWSYDSFLLYVYDRDALDIWIDGESADGVSLSNVKAISEMSQDEILALNRDIYLKAMVSVNYGEYAWTELSDQMQWASSDSSVAPVTYQQGTLYENIEHFSYTSYRPTTDFGITGRADGTVEITATHALTGIDDSVTVDVERLDNRLYLFQCYPQTKTTLYYTNGDGETKTAVSDEDGAAAIYEESGIASDVFCQCEYEGITYIGTVYENNLKSGEGDWTLLERYPCNNLTLRRAAYAYMYIKNPDGTPYTGSVNVRGGVYVDDKYIADAYFDYNGEQNGDARQPGDEDYAIKLGSDGKLAITMDQTQWGTDTGAANTWNNIYYIFEISLANDETEYYPMIVTIDATVNEAAYVGNGEAVVTFRENPSEGKHPFIVEQRVYHGGSMESVLDGTESVGPSATYPTAQLYTMAMWWGEEDVGDEASLQLFTSEGKRVSTGEGKYEISQTDYPFSDQHITTYAVRFDEESMEGVLEAGDNTTLYLEYYKDGAALTRREDLSFSLSNMIGIEEVSDSNTLLAEIQNMGTSVGTDTDGASDELGTTDKYVQAALNFASDSDYSTGDGNIFSMQLAPTSDPTKFLGFMEVNIGQMEMGDDDDDDDSQIYFASTFSEDDDWEYWPGMDELATLAGQKSVTDYFADAKENIADGAGGKSVDDHDLSYSLGGYMETLIYYDYNSSNWKMKVLSGGFNAGGGYEWCWNFNTWVGPVPFTATLKIGAEARVNMDAITAAYTEADDTAAMGSDILTELRMYLYLYFFAGVGIDYAVVAFKLGVYGQVDLDMRFDWLNRKYLSDGGTPTTNDNTDTKLKGQHFEMNGEVGLELVVKVLFIEYEKVLFSYSFNMFDKDTGQWKTLQDIWDADQDAYDDMINGMLKTHSLTVTNVGGESMLELNLAATREDVSYLNDGSTWGGISTLALDDENGLSTLNENSYAYADPVVTEDGEMVAFLGIPASYGIKGEGDVSSENVSAMFALKSGESYASPMVIPDPEIETDEKEDDTSAAGYGDSELSLAGDEDFAVAAWTRQTVDIAKDDGAVLTDEDQRMMMESTDVCVSVWDGSEWDTTLIENGGSDMAPVVATNGKNAIVAWRSVASSATNTDITDFDQKDNILYKLYEKGEWSETYTLYNGTSGNVKGITAEMLSNGTAAVSYALDKDEDADTYTDREIVYAVIDKDGEVVRNVRATNDTFLDENPQLTTVKIDGNERFLLGWYTEESGIEGIDGSEDTSGESVTADIRFIDFDEEGNATQLMPDSLSSAATGADVSITSDFAFTKSDGSIDINNLSIVWPERTVTDEYIEHDVLKAVKFYTNNGQITFTGAAGLAEMSAGTLVDSFDAYTTGDGTTVKAVIMGTTYGPDVEEKIGEASGGEIVSYEVPCSETSMYTATETYENTIDVPDFLPDYEMLKLGAKTEIMFNIENKGVDPVKSVSVSVGGTETEFKDLNLLPGADTQVYADYQVPYDAVQDETFTVTATFTDGSTYTFGAEDHEDEANLIYMNLPDIQITDASIIREEDGERDIMIKLNNTSDAALGESSNTSARLSFYSDATYESPIESLPDIDITDPAELKMVDEGGYSTVVTFNVADYLETSYGELTEIPETGVNVYVKAEVIDETSEPDDETGKLQAQGEPKTSNNYAMVTCENLQVRSGQDVTITTTLDIADDNSVNVKVDLQNTRLTTTTKGNVVVTLIAEDGSILAQQQSYTDQKGLLTLTGEERATEEFAFTDIDVPFTVDVQYMDMVLTTDEEIPEGLEELLFPSLDEDISLSDFTWDEEKNAYVCEVTTDTVWNLSVIATARDAGATITINEDKTEFYTVGTNLAVTPGDDNVISITVENQNGVKTTYILTVHNETRTFEGRATWDDEDDQDGYRPESITVRVIADGEKALDKDGNEITATVTADDDWSWSFTYLPIYNSSGEEIVYELREDIIEGYNVTYNGFSLTNKHVTDTISVGGSKTWDDDDNQDGYRPESITVRLLADGEPALDEEGNEITATVTAADNWSWQFANLPEHRDGGQDIVYNITEDAVANYATYYNGYDVTNSHTTDQTSVTVVSAWDDDDDRDGVRPEELTVELYADGKKVKDNAVTLTADGSWVNAFTELDMFRDEGAQIEYTIELADSDKNYDYTITGDAKTGYIINLVHEIETIEVSGSKTWDDDDDRDGIRPESITINLLADGAPVLDEDGNEISATVTPTEAGTVSQIIAFFSGNDNEEWSWSFTDLPRYRDGGIEIEYSVTEDEVEGYETEITGYDVTNTHSPATTAVSGSAMWDDAENQDGIRPEGITVHLYADGEEIDSLAVTAEDEWSWNFTELPVYRDGGIEIAYTITIDALDGYSTMYEGFNLTNSYTPGQTSVSVQKVWDDEDDKDGIRPSEITVQLYADGEAVEDAVLALNEENGWQGSFTELNIYRDGGTAIAYTVSECDVPEEYESVVTGDAETGFVITNSYTPLPDEEPEEEVIANTSSISPQTGASIAALAMAMSLAAAGIVVVSRKKKDKK